MKAVCKSFGAFALGSVVLASATLASSAPDKPAGGISTLPTPWIIAHRGGPLLWPEETMAAYEASTAAGNSFVEVDCWLLNRDEAIGVMHDASLSRTTNSNKLVGKVYPGEWKQLRVDGSKLLGPGWGFYEAPFLDEILARFRNRKIIFVEAKDGRSGVAIVSKLHAYGVSKDYAVVNAFQESQLQAAKSVGYLTCLNTGDLKRTPESLKGKGYWGVLIPYAGEERTTNYVKEAKAVGLRVLAETNRQFERDELIKCGIDGIYTDDPLYLDMSGAYRQNTDPYSTQKWAAGMLEGQAGGRGHFTPPNKWGVEASFENTFKSCLQGWMCPIGGNLVASDWSLELSVTFGPRLQDGRWANVAILTTDAALNNDITPAAIVFGYSVLFSNTGGLAIYRYDGGRGKGPIMLKDCRGPVIKLGETVKYRITTTPNLIKVERLDGKASLSVEDDHYRGAYVTFGAKGQRADFSEVVLSVNK